MFTDSKALIGQTLGTCTLERQIGHGGMGAVYLARQTRPHRSIAIKVLLPGPDLDERAREDFLNRFRREADAIAMLDHIHIMPIYEYGEQDQQAYLVMPYVTGGTLHQILARRGSLPVNEALPIIEQISEALDYAHARGIIHRDIKPGNILFHADGRLLLADFGLAKILSEAGETSVSLQLQNRHTEQENHDSPSPSHGAMIGTPAYLSPEQALGKQVDRRTDIYSLGILLFQMLTGRVPFTASSPVTTAILHIQNDPPSPSSLMPTISPEVEAVILRAIAKQPDQRYATAGEFARAMRAASGEPTQSGSSGNRKNANVVAQLLFNNDTEPEIERIRAASAPTYPTEQPSNSQTQSSPALQVEQTPEPPATPPSPYLQEPEAKSRQNRHPLLVALCTLLVLVLILGGLFAYFDLSRMHSPQQPQITATAPGVFPDPPVPVGNRIYATTILDSTCQGGAGSWSQDGNAIVLCRPTTTELINTLHTQQYLASIFLNGLDNGYSIPTNYILQVDATLAPGSQGSFGVLLRNQPDQGNIRHNGAYSFLIDPASATWEAISYNDATGKATYLAKHSYNILLQGTIRFDVIVQGATFTFYLDGQLQGSAVDATYPTGTLGFSVNPGADIYFSNLALYEPYGD